jgi:ABC-type uncharacterized transport system permease subunit
MTTTVPATGSTSASPLPAAITLVKSWKMPIVFGVFSIISIVLFIVLRRGGTSTFSFTTSTDFVRIPAAAVSDVVTGIVVSVIAVAITAVSIYLVAHGRRVPLWLSAIFTLSVVFGFLAWSSVGGTLPIPGTLAGALALSVPLIFGSMGGVLSERVGVVNVAIEGQLLAGAFSASLIASITGSAFAGILAAVVAGTLVSLVLAAFSIKYLVDQVIVGIVLNVLVSGLTGFFYTTVIVNLNGATPHIDPIAIPLLSTIPVIGPVLFNQTVIVYLMYLAVFLVYFALFHTRWGLRVRAVGEHPKAADTVGIRVNRTRFLTVALAGAIVGFGGAYFTVGSGVGFAKDMTNGAGYIALAAVIFGRWDPIRATLAALLFGFVSNLQSVLGLLHAPIPSEFLRMLPYLVTIFAVAGLVGRARGPAASGKPYIKA